MKNVAIKVDDFDSAVALLEYNWLWDYAESEGPADMRFDDDDASIWVRKGNETIIEGCMSTDLQKMIMKTIPGAEIF